MLFDSHVHMGLEQFDKDREELFQAITESDLKYVVEIAFDLESSVKAVNLAKELPWCYAAVGCHPHDTKTMDDASLVMIKGLARKPKVVAIGEIGLDYYHNHSERDVQQYWFRKQIQMAMELEKPIIIHDRDANEDVMNILKEEGAFSKRRTGAFPVQPDGTPDARVILHCYSGSREMAEQYVKLGATISIAGPITYKNARRNIEVADRIPLSKLLIETDCPYLSPEPFRGKRNDPLKVKYTCQKVAEIKNLPFEEVAKATCENAIRVFGI